MKEGKKKKLLESVIEEEGTLIIYESPFRVKKTLALLKEVMGERHFVLAHELTKIHEGFFRGPLTDWEQITADLVEKGEWVILVSGKNYE